VQQTLDHDSFGDELHAAVQPPPPEAEGSTVRAPSDPPPGRPWRGDSHASSHRQIAYLLRVCRSRRQAASLASSPGGAAAQWTSAEETPEETPPNSSAPASRPSWLELGKSLSSRRTLALEPSP
jgi:hypothetical protein